MSIDFFLMPYQKPSTCFVRSVRQGMPRGTLFCKWWIREMGDFLTHSFEGVKNLAQVVDWVAHRYFPSPSQASPMRAACRSGMAVVMLPASVVGLRRLYQSIRSDHATWSSRAEVLDSIGHIAYYGFSGIASVQESVKWVGVAQWIGMGRACLQIFQDLIERQVLHTVLREFCQEDFDVTQWIQKSSPEKLMQRVVLSPQDAVQLKKAVLVRSNHDKELCLRAELVGRVKRKIFCHNLQTLSSTIYALAAVCLVVQMSPLVAVTLSGMAAAIACYRWSQERAAEADVECLKKRVWA